MTVGETIPGSLADSLPTIIADARIVKEFEGVWQRTCDVRKQAEHTGTDWNEISLAQLQGQGITNTTINENPQQFADTLFAITPQMTQILIKVTDRTYRQIAAVVEAKMGTLAGNAMARLKDEDYLSLFASMGTGASPGAGNPMAFGYIAAAKNRITSNTTESSTQEVFTVLHGHQIYDIQSEITAGVGTYPLPVGMTEEVFRKGFMGMVTGSHVFEDGNITINSSTDDARGATHSREGVVAVLAMAIKTETRRDPGFGGGATEVFMTDEYGFGARASGIWNFAHLSDASEPTS